MNRTAQKPYDVRRLQSSKTLRSLPGAASHLGVRRQRRAICTRAEVQQREGLRKVVLEAKEATAESFAPFGQVRRMACCCPRRFAQAQDFGGKPRSPGNACC